MIELKRVEWSLAAEDSLGCVLGLDLPDIRKQVLSGECELWHVDGEGFVISRVELYENYSEMVLIAGAASGEHKTTYLDTVKAFCNVAASVGVDSVRIHTQKPAIGRMLGTIGFNEQERVYCLSVKDCKK